MCWMQTAFPYWVMAPGAKSWLFSCILFVLLPSSLASVMNMTHVVFLLGSDSHYGKKGQQVSFSSSGVVGIHTPGVMPCVVVPLSTLIPRQTGCSSSCCAPVPLVPIALSGRRNCFCFFQVSHLIMEQILHFFASFLLND